MLSVACASAPKRAQESGAGLRYGPQCAAARDRARGTPDSLPGLAPPTSVELFLSPLPVPDRVKGRSARITLRVDSAGTPIAETLLVTGIDDRAYLSRLRSAALKMRYRPAVLDGCAVEGTARLRYDFAP
jgi:hypothetical protein